MTKLEAAISYYKRRKRERVSNEQILAEIFALLGIK